MHKIVAGVAYCPVCSSKLMQTTRLCKLPVIKMVPLVGPFQYPKDDGHPKYKLNETPQQSLVGQGGDDGPGQYRGD